MKFTPLPFSVSKRFVKDYLIMSGAKLFCITTHSMQSGPSMSGIFMGSHLDDAFDSYVSQGHLGAYQVRKEIEDSDMVRIKNQLTSLKEGGYKAFRIDNIIVTVRESIEEENRIFLYLMSHQESMYAEQPRAVQWYMENRGMLNFAYEEKLAKSLFNQEGVRVLSKFTLPCLLPECNDSFASNEELINHMRTKKHYVQGELVSEEIVENIIDIALKELL